VTDSPKLRIVTSFETAEVLSDGAGVEMENPAPPLEDHGNDGPETGSSAPEDFSGGAGAAGSDGDLDMACAWLPRTDLGNAQRFVRRHGEKFLFVPEWGWLAWDGKRWNTEEADAILARAVHQTVKDIEREASAFADSPHDTLLDEKRDIWTSDKLRGWCLASQGNAHISCIARLAQAYLTATPDQFDADPMAMNVDNGTLRFAKTEDGDYITFHPHHRGDRMTKLAPVTYDPAAASPVYDKFLDRVQPDAAMRRHLHAWGGVSLTALPLARLAFWYGTGRNGKSTLIDCWANVMGGYSQTIPIESFLDQGRSRRGGEASPDIASLPGIRCLRTSEPERGAKLAESMVKLVTGGEMLRARHLNKDFFEFRPGFKLTMQGNYKPIIGGTDEGIWARVFMVPWGVMIPEAERDARLPEKLRAEASGILNRLLDGLRDYLDNGLSPPDAVLAATAEYRDDSDPMGRFLNECTVRRPEAENVRVGGQEIYRLYVAWAKASGEKPWSPKAFSRGLQEHGVIRLKSSGMHYRHLVLIKSVMDFRGEEIEAADDK